MSARTNNAISSNRFQHIRGKREVGEASLATYQIEIKRPRTMENPTALARNFTATGRSESRKPCKPTVQHHTIEPFTLDFVSYRDHR
jgi:hypothetical protein